MMKRLLTVVAFVAAALSMNAQVFKAESVKNFAKKNIMASPAKAATGTIWWGYGDINTVEDYGVLGTQRTETYDIAMRITGDNSSVVGKAIKAISVALYQKSVLKDVKVWLSTSLPTSASAANICCVDVPSADLVDLYTDGKTIDVELPEAYTVTNQGVYVGYTFTVTNVSGQGGQYPIVMLKETDVPNTLFISTPAIGGWQDAKQYGMCATRVLLEGEFASDNAAFADFGNIVVAMNGTVKKNVALIGKGVNQVNNISYKMTIDGVDQEEKTVNVNPAISLGTTGNVEIEFPGASEAKVQDVKLTVTKVNGESSEVEANAATGKITTATVSKLVDRGIVVEEYTGTGCGWCPRGWVGMEKMREKFGDKFIGAAIHQYNSSDPMYITPANYAKLGFAGAPSCMINRASGGIDPYYGTGDDICDDIQAALEVPAVVGLDVTGEYNEDGTEVNAKATVEALIDGGPYAIEYVLIADGLEGGTSSWKQSNYYTSYSSSQLPEDIAPFGNGGAWGQDKVSLVFNDVAIASSYSSSMNQAEPIGTMTAGEVKENTFTLKMPTKAALKKAIILDKVAVLAFIINPDGTIENGAKFYLQPSEELGIADNATVKEATAVGYYSVDGRQLAQPQRGLNIVKMSDGSIKKVLVK